MPKRFFCLLLAAMTLLAGSFHILCDAKIIECAPCQQSSSSGEDHDGCPACSLSVAIAKTCIAPGKVVMPAMLILVEDTTFVVVPLAELLDGNSCCARPEISGLQKEQHLLDLAQSIPIRGPSLTA